MSTRKWFIAPLVSVALLGVPYGCAQEEATLPLTPANVSGDLSEQAIDALTNARCNHAQRCNQIGRAAPFADREECLSASRSAAAKVVDECRAGNIDREDLARCVGDIQNQACGSELETTEGWVACRADDLCLG